MAKCIKCGREIPKGELFCHECSLNPAKPAADVPPAPRRSLGQMQAPQKLPKPQAAVAAPPKPQAKKKSSAPLVTALVLVSLALTAVLALCAWQYGSFQAAKNKLESKERKLAVQEADLTALQAQMEELQKQLDEANANLAAKDEEIQTLAKELSGSQSDKNQTSYDLSTTEAELDKLTEENRQLADLADDLEGQVEDLNHDILELEEALKAADQYKAKAEFMDDYVVFVENNKSGVYHTYDCKDFTRSNFWAYSRKLAESNGYKPCPTCGGKAN